jgi:hypothetical protein
MISGTRNAPSPQHSPSLFEDFWLHGGHRRSRAENIFYADSPGAFDGAICRTCQHREGAALSAASKAWKDLFGF